MGRESRSDSRSIAIRIAPQCDGDSARFGSRSGAAGCYRPDL